jgi:hypothetical protein
VRLRRRCGMPNERNRKEVADMDVGYWFEFWWLFPIALGICVTV